LAGNEWSQALLRNEDNHPESAGFAIRRERGVQLDGFDQSWLLPYRSASSWAALEKEALRVATKGILIDAVAPLPKNAGLDHLLEGLGKWMAQLRVEARD